MIEQLAAQKKEEAFFVDPFQNGAAPGKTAASEVSLSEQSSRKGYIKDIYKVSGNQPIAELSTDFARAYPVAGQKSVSGGELYALIFNRNFPVNVDALEFMQSMDGTNFCKIIDLGKIRHGDGEYFAAIMERPRGVPLRKVLQSGFRFNERKLYKEIIFPLSVQINEFHESGYCLGNINLDNVYYDQATTTVVIKEWVSEFCGVSQPVVFDTLNRICCQPEAKGNRDLSCDYYALGVLVVSLIEGEELLKGLSKDEIISRKLRQGTIDCIAADMTSGKTHNLKNQTVHMLRGLLCDYDKDRWDGDDIFEWYNDKEKGPPPTSRVHKETTTAFIFEGNEYLSRKHLAYDLHKNWAKAKASLSIEEVSRWIKLAIKLPRVSDFIDTLVENKIDSGISDEKLSRLIHLIDSDGPIRFQNYAISIWGLQPFIANAFIESKKDYLQFLGRIFSLGLVENWINIQETPEDYSFSNLLWTPFKIGQYMHRTSPGFGMERCLYMLNPTLSCQSPIVAKYYTSDLSDFMLALDERGKDGNDKVDPLDRHGAAFIGTKIDLSDEIRVKSVQRHPALARNPHIAMLAMLTVAQGATHIRTLKGLTNWMKARVSTISDDFHNPRIRKDFLAMINKASRNGSLNELFKAVSDPMFAKRDQSGFIEAKKQYRILMGQMAALGKQSNIEKMAYQYGLRISVMFAYFVAVTTLLIIVIRSA